MPDLDREMNRLAVEVGEARKQSSQTETQLGELLGVFRDFEARFDGVERRARASHFGTHLVAALVVAGATYMVASMQTREAKGRLKDLMAEVSEQRAEIAQREADVAATRKRIEQEAVRRAAANAAAEKLIAHLRAGREKEVEATLPALDLANLDPLARKLVESRVKAFRSKVAESAYKWGRELLSRRRRQDGIAELRRAVRVWPNGPQADSARYWLANSLREAKRYNEAASVFSDIRKRDDDEAIQEEAEYWEAYCRARVGDFESARKLFNNLAAAGGSHAGSARAQLRALEAARDSAATTTQ